jgi:ABC-type bacteriocin/lantibiotic exporter with double-glycine peptidase domain
VQMLIVNAIDPVSTVGLMERKVQQTNVDLEKLADVLRHPREPHEALPAATPGESVMRLTGSVELRHVTFGYSRVAPPVIREVSLSVKAGQRVALVGASGSGKSTVAKLIAGLYEPWSGEVVFDGRSRKDIPRSVLTDSLAIVDQDIALFKGTIRENLTLWDDTLPDDAMLAAARDAHIHRDIVRQRNGYESRVEEAGRNLSGGQRQRLEIARALATAPRVLVLDEATSALDPDVEKRVEDSLRRRGCTCVIVAHRLSTIRDCDEILVFERGVVVQRGRHDEMAYVAGPYQRLIAAT